MRENRGEKAQPTAARVKKTIPTSRRCLCMNLMLRNPMVRAPTKATTEETVDICPAAPTLCPKVPPISMRRRLTRREGIPKTKRVTTRDGRTSLPLPEPSAPPLPSRSKVNTFPKDCEEDQESTMLTRKGPTGNNFSETTTRPQFKAICSRVWPNSNGNNMVSLLSLVQRVPRYQ